MQFLQFFASCSVTPSLASITTITISARSTAETVRIILYRSNSSLIFALSAQSCRIYKYVILPIIVYCVVSMGISGRSCNIRYNNPVFFPNSLLTIDDFPTLEAFQRLLFWVYHHLPVFLLSFGNHFCHFIKHIAKT